MQPGVFNCLCARAPVRVRGSTSPVVLRSVFLNIWNTRNMTLTKLQHCHSKMIVCKGMGGGRALVWCSFCPFTKHLLGASFLVTPSCGATATSSKTGTYVPARRCKSAGPGRKGVGWMCVCEKRAKISVISIPGDFPFSFKKKYHNFYSVLPACFP